MAKKLMRSQLNQIRAWVRQGRTDAWIAHQLEVSASELRDFRRRHELSADDEAADDVDLRDEIEAEIEATMAQDAEEVGEEAEDEAPSDERPAAEREGEGGGGRRRRRRRRGPKRPGAGLQATFDHGEEEGFGLWLDPAVQEDPLYTEHWKDHRPVEVTIEADRIVIRRS
jgi:hypothetical protein